MIWKEIVVLWLYLTHSVRSEDLIRLKQSKLYELYNLIISIIYSSAGQHYVNSFLSIIFNQGVLRDGVPTGNNEFKQLSVL